MMPKLWIWGWICLLKSCEGLPANISNVPSKVGDTVNLPCHTTFNEPVDWRYQKQAALVEEYACTAVEPYAKGITNCEDYDRWPRIDVNSSTPGDYTLTVRNVTVNDSGLYHCVEESGAGMRHTFRLTVSVPECDSNPCQNNATCTVGDNWYTCACRAGFTGTNCDTDVNECLSEPCQYGGVCRHGINTYTCKCPLGFAGINCETDVNECLSEPCQNGGDCRHGINTYTCKCPLSFAGINCETVVEKDNLLVSAILAIILPVIVIALVITSIGVWLRKRHQRNKSREGNEEEGNDQELLLKDVAHQQPQGSRQLLPLARAINNSVRGLATLGSKWYVLYVNGIDVFATQPPYKLQTSIQVEGLKDPQEIAACSINNCLYVNDWRSEYVWKVKSSDEVTKKKKVPTATLR